MSSPTVYDAVRAHLVANWTTTPFVFDNENTDTNNEDPTSRTGPWVMVEMTSDFDSQASIGSGSQSTDLYREEGIIFLTVLVPAGSGSRIARTYAKTLIDLFKGVELAAGTIRFQDRSIGVGQKAQRDGNWFELPATVAYEADA